MEDGSPHFKKARSAALYPREPDDWRYRSLIRKERAAALLKRKGRAAIIPLLLEKSGEQTPLSSAQNRRDRQIFLLTSMLYC
jgi:hypothetical protein